MQHGVPLCVYWSVDTHLLQEGCTPLMALVPNFISKVSTSAFNSNGLVKTKGSVQKPDLQLFWRKANSDEDPIATDTFVFVWGCFWQYQMTLSTFTYVDLVLETGFLHDFVTCPLANHHHFITLSKAVLESHETKRALLLTKHCCLWRYFNLLPG